MVIAGAPEPRADHAAVIVDMALEMLAVADQTEPTPGSPLRLRIGIASGPAVAGVIGHRKFSYDVWGDAVNLASRMESTGVPGTIQVAASTWRLCADRYPFRSREVDVKGLGPLQTFLLDPAPVPPGPHDATSAAVVQDRAIEDRRLGPEQSATPGRPSSRGS